MSCPVCKNIDFRLLKDYIAHHSIFSELKIVSCNKCGLAYASPMPSNNKLNKYYKGYWNGEIASITPKTSRYYLAQSINRVCYLKSKINLRDGISVLDIGSGPGIFLDALNLEGLNINYFAIEPDLMQSKILLKKNTVKKVFSKIEVVDKSTKFDLIILSHVLEHVNEPHSFIKKIISMLKPNGNLYIEVPNQDHLFKKEFEPHILFFDQSSLIDLLGSYGKVVNIECFGPNLKQEKNGLFRLIFKIKEKFNSLIINLVAKNSKQLIKQLKMNDLNPKGIWIRALIKKSYSK